MGISPQSEGNSDEVFLENFINTLITPNQDGSYNAKFLWKEDSQLLPANYSKCEKRTWSMVRRLTATPKLLTTYGNIIAEQEVCDFIEKVDEARPTDSAHYIPHHPVRKDSATTPIRIVYDCSFHSSFAKPSLNDCLHAAHHSSMICVQFFCGSVPSPMACRQTSKRRFSTLALTKAQRLHQIFLAI